MNSEKVLSNLMELLTLNLSELSTLTNTPFIHGEKTAYLECLEILLSWEKSSEYPHAVKLVKTVKI